MTPALKPFPTLAPLSRGLNQVLTGNGLPAGPVAVLKRKPLLPGMTFPTEIVTCRLAGDQKLHLFCKYEAGRNHNAHGHRGGVSYEAEIYEGLLQELPVRTPEFYGAFRNARAGETWLILRFLDQGKLVRDLYPDIEKRPQPTAIGLAAPWIGRFHARTAARPAQPPLPFLNRYGPAYYRGSAGRTVKFTGKMGSGKILPPFRLAGRAAGGDDRRETPLAPRGIALRRRKIGFDIAKISGSTAHLGEFLSWTRP